MQKTHKKQRKISDSKKITKTSTGIYRVVIAKDEICLNCFKWVYGYQNNGKRIEISRTNLLELKKEVLSRGLEQITNDSHNAIGSLFIDKNKPKIKKKHVQKSIKRN